MSRTARGRRIETFVTVVNLPFSTLLSGDRSCELPPRDVRFDLVLDDDVSLAEVAELFTSRISKNTGQSRTPWSVRYFVSSTSLLTSPPAPNVCTSPYTPTLPLPRLWKPDPMVSSKLLPLLLPSPPSLILDLGSGAGRDVCYLAESLSLSNASVKVVGIDKHKGSSRRSLPLWSNRGVEKNTEHALLDLKKIDNFTDYVSWRDHPGCIYAVRYLSRPLFQYIAATSPLNMIFALSHFVVNLDSTFPYDHPSMKEVLQLGEVEGMFSEGWEIFACERVKDSDAGRTLLHFVARRTTEV